MKRLLLLAALLATTASAAPVDLESMTWTELRAAIDAGSRTAIVPIGGTEQNGPHMALGKHNLRALALSRRIATALGDAVVAPVVAYVPEGAIDPPAAHMKWPGTISIPQDAFEKSLEGAARSLLHHGFRRVVLLGDHGGYRASLDRVARRVNAGGAGRVLVPAEYYREMEHAGRDDTSLALAIDPGLVRADHLAAPARGDGVAGDPRGASVERGREVEREIVERTVAAIRSAPAPVK